MLNAIKGAIKLYKKANNYDRVHPSEYPTVLANLFDVQITTNQLKQMSAEQLMDILMKKV